MQLAAWVLLAVAPGALAQELTLKPCWLKGIETQARCGQLERALDPAQPQGRKITLHLAVLPAVAANKKPDPVVMLAGGPGQSAIELAAGMGRLMARLNNRRDIVLVDQRGTGRSAPLRCDQPEPDAPLGELLGAEPVAQLRQCLQALVKLPHVGEEGSLKHFSTTVAMADLDAVRQALKVESINLVGGSYGTRAALEYMRQFPKAVRRSVIDGVAPPDMALPQSFSVDSQAALDGLLAWCEFDPACKRSYPGLRQRWQALLASMPREVAVMHPLTGRPDRMTLRRDVLLNLVRGPLYVPTLSSALPQAIYRAAQGQFEPLLGLASAMGGRGREGALAQGMHFSVVCAEDLPRMAADAPAGADFGHHFAQLYQQVCSFWPRAQVDAGFYAIAPAGAPTLVLSGGLDPATPPRHGQRVAAALGPKARHEVVQNAGHGVMGVPCMRDVLYRFIDAADDAAALEVDLSCARASPRPAAYGAHNKDPRK